MKLNIPLLLFSASLCFYSCSNNGKNINNSRALKQPEFYDNGKTIDSLKKVYNFESIEYDNWKENDATDSCFTVCLINSNKVPLADNIDSTSNQLNGIALAIKKSLLNPQKYNSYYIIFVKKDKVNGMDTKVHSAGMEIPTAQL